MYLVAIAWMYVVVMMTVVEATSANGTVLGALFTFLLYGALPLSVVLYILRSPARKRARLAAEAPVDPGPGDEPSHHEPDSSHHAPGDAITPERKEA
ncbi:MAG: hypothetical protein CFE40_06365 [Burkholderiales bacterium PBB1]|nr:MAG: hypothetical protein CFE40_06365 [Burkholderiales bacterium PBB1]